MSEVCVKNKKKSRRRSNRHFKKKKTVLRRSNWACHYCGREDKFEGVRLTLDHVFPRSKGGKDGNKNLVACCPDCNQAKDDMSKEEFFELYPELRKLQMDLNNLNGTFGRAPWCGNPYSDLYNCREFWINYFGV